MFSITANTDKLRQSIEAIRLGLQETQTGPMADGLRRAGAVYLGAMRRRFQSASHGDGTWPDLAESTKRGRLAKRGSFASAKRGNDEMDRFGKAAPGFAAEWKEAREQAKKARTRFEKEKAKLRVRVLRDRLGRARDRHEEHRIKAQIKSTKAKAGLRNSQSDLYYKSLGKFAILADTSTLKNSLTEGSPGNVSELIPGGIVVGTNIFYAVYHQLGTANGRPPKREILVQPNPDTEARMMRVIDLAVRKVIRDATKK